MPIYYGCPNILDYFPQEALVFIDINKPDEAIEIIKETIASDLWVRNQEAIIHARNLVLDKYQFYPFFSKIIHDNEQVNPTYKSAYQKNFLNSLKLPFYVDVARKIKQMYSKLS